MEEKSIISPRVAILGVVASFLLLMFLGAIIFLLFGEGIAMVISELLVLVIPLGYMIYKGVNIKNYIGLNLSPKNITIGVVFGAVFFSFDILISILLTIIFGPSQIVEESNELLANMSSSLGGLLLVITSLSLAGICEEFTFRGFLQTAVNSKYPFGIALIVSSLAFGIFHFDPQGIYTISAFLIGLLLGYVYHRYKSYVVSAVAHTTVNLIALTLLLLIG